MSKAKRYKDRDDLAGEHALGDLGQIVLLIIFLTTWIVDSFIINYSTFLAKLIPNFLRIVLSVIVMFLSLYLAGRSLKIVFGETRQEPGVIVKGPFKLIRHPIYVSAILYYFGLLLLSPSILAAIVWIFIMVFYYFISRYEERLLLEKFGDAYADYMKKVPMFIPRLKKQNFHDIDNWYINC